MLNKMVNKLERRERPIISSHEINEFAKYEKRVEANGNGVSLWRAGRMEKSRKIRGNAFQLPGTALRK